MGSKQFKLIFTLLVITLLFLLPAAYTYGANGNKIDALIGQETVRLEAADPSVAPSFNALGGLISGVTPGDLFYVDAADHTGEIALALHLTNIQELIHYYRYLILRVGIYAKSSDGSWQEVSGVGGELIPEAVISLHNGQVLFTLPGSSEYRVSINGGNFKCFASNTSGKSLSPQFYLTADRL